MSPAVPQTIVKQKVVLVEGKDEVNVFDAIYAASGINDVQVIAFEGKEKLPGFLAVVTKDPSFPAVTSLAIVRDADANAAGAFTAVTNALGANALPAPPRPETFHPGPPRKVGVFILPGGSAAGALEDVFVAANNPSGYLTCTRQFSACCIANGRPAFSAKDTAHGLLLALEAPQARLGMAFKLGMVNAAHKAYDDLRGFLQAV